MRLSRRRLLAQAMLAGVGVGSLCLERALALTRLSPPCEDSHRRAAELLSDGGAAAAVGWRYLAANPEEADIDRLLGEILSGRPAHTRAALWRRASAQHREDFRCGNVAVVDGWVLSRTEARLCAATALLHSDVC